jgi:hypothetical protein
MWEEWERERLGPVAVISAEDGRVTEVFMLDGHDIFRSGILFFCLHNCFCIYVCVCE